MEAFGLLLLGLIVVVVGILWLRLHPFIALLGAALLIAAVTPSTTLKNYALSQGQSETQATAFAQDPAVKRVTTHFGSTCAKIGILIALAAVIGKCLLESGAAERLIRSSIRFVGEEKSPLAFMSTGFLLGIPVFFDTVFYLMMPLAKAMGVRQAGKYGLFVMAIIAGGTMAHSLVPPTPGPLLVASELGIDLGRMILGGFLLGIVTMLSGYAYALWVNRRFPLPLRETADVSLSHLKEIAERKESDLPPFFLSLLPIALPIFLISGATICSVLWKDSGSTLTGFPHWAWQFFSVFGEKTIALLIATAVALGLLFWKWRSNPSLCREAMQTALAGGGVIILITAAGGAFGGVLQQTGIATQIEKGVQSGWPILPLAFLVTTLIRCAQGSATVAMITTVGIVSGISANGLAFDPLYLALAIGCGSKPFPWMNDSGFWIICQLSGMTEKETLRNFSVLLSIMGITGLLFITLLARLIPFPFS